MVGGVKGAAAFAVGALSAVLLGAGEAAAEVARGADDNIEEMVVTAERLEKGAIPTQTVMVQTYNVLRRGKRLYSAGRYKEALPYLLVAAKRGFKWAQAMAGDIYIHGRGGAPQDVVSGLGWLGVAARPQTAPAIQSYFSQAMAEVPEAELARMKDVVARYRERWSSRGWRVSCRRSSAGSPLGMGVMSLRLNRRLSCSFMDEVPVCREPLGSIGEVLDPDAPLPFRWVCPPVTG